MTRLDSGRHTAKVKVTASRRVGEGTSTLVRRSRASLLHNDIRFTQKIENHLQIYCDFLVASGPDLIHGSLVSLSVQPFMHSSPVCPAHAHTDHATCDSCSNKPHLLTACRQWGLKTNMHIKHNQKTL